VYRVALNKRGHPASPQTSWKHCDQIEWKLVNLCDISRQSRLALLHFLFGNSVRSRRKPQPFSWCNPFSRQQSSFDIVPILLLILREKNKPKIYKTVTPVWRHQSRRKWVSKQEHIAIFLFYLVMEFLRCLQWVGMSPFILCRSILYCI